MTNQEDLDAFFERFANSGQKHGFRLLDGSEYLGWVMEVIQDALLFAHAPSPIYAQASGNSDMAPADEWIELLNIEIASLSYWNTELNQWVAFS